jgi:hypothetical protein
METQTAMSMRVPNFLLAGLAGMLAQSALMSLKVSLGVLPDFHPYGELQRLLRSAFGAHLSPGAVWLLSYLKGSLIVGFVFSRLFHRLPSRTGAIKGAIFGLGAWLAFGVLLFPALGMGVFGTHRGTAPLFFSLLMLLVYSVTMGVVYSSLSKR